MANYHANRGAVDNDDGSAYYSTHDNFFVYADGGLKNDFGGHDNHHFRNVYAYTGKGINLCPQLVGHEDWFYDNKVVLTKANATLGTYDCHPTAGHGKVLIHDNALYTPDGATAWVCGAPEPGSAVGFLPEAEAIMAWAKQRLGLPFNVS